MLITAHYNTLAARTKANQAKVNNKLSSQKPSCTELAAQRTSIGGRPIGVVTGRKNNATRCVIPLATNRTNSSDQHKANENRCQKLSKSNGTPQSDTRHRKQGQADNLIETFAIGERRVVCASMVRNGARLNSLQLTQDVSTSDATESNRI